MKLLTRCVIGSALLACTKEVSKAPAPEPLLQDTAVVNPATSLSDPMAPIPQHYPGLCRR